MPQQVEVAVTDNEGKEYTLTERIIQLEELDVAELRCGIPLDSPVDS